MIIIKVHSTYGHINDKLKYMFNFILEMKFYHYYWKKKRSIASVKYIHRLQIHFLKVYNEQ